MKAVFELHAFRWLIFFKKSKSLWPKFRPRISHIIWRLFHCSVHSIKWNSACKDPTYKEKKRHEKFHWKISKKKISMWLLPVIFFWEKSAAGAYGGITKRTITRWGKTPLDFSAGLRMAELGCLYVLLKITGCVCTWLYIGGKIGDV